MAARWRFVGGFTLVVFALATAMFLGDRPSTQPAPAGEADLAPSSVAPDLQTVSAGVDRAVYPFSFIAGGGQTVDEL